MTDPEITQLAGFLELGEPEFIQRYTRLTQDRRGLALQEQPDGACVFLADNDCAVQSVKPQQCRDFPNLWRHPEAENQCRAVPQTLSDEEHVQRVAQVSGRTTAAVREILRSRQ